MSRTQIALRIFEFSLKTVENRPAKFYFSEAIEMFKANEALKPIMPPRTFTCKLCAKWAIPLMLFSRVALKFIIPLVIEIYRLKKGALHENEIDAC